MKPTRTLAACLALALPLAAWSQDPASSPSRAEVKQEGQQALKQGQTPVGDKVTNKPDTSAPSNTSRAKVKAAASGSTSGHGDVGDKVVDTHPRKSSASSPASSKTRQQVKDEAHQANREGEIPTGDLGKGSGADIANTPANRKAAAAASAGSK
jgi:hypothetical protein